MDDVDSAKVLSCVFFDDVLCSYRKDKRFGVMDRCTKCRYYEQFMREMAEEDEKVMDEIGEVEKLHASYLRGEISEEEYRKRFFAVGDGESE